MRPVILIARPRSGTTAFRLVVSAHQRIMNVGEIFHGDHVDDPTNFYNCYAALVAEQPELALPAPAHRIRLFDAYVQRLVADLAAKYRDKEWVFLGVNYNSLHSLNTFWQNVYEPPFLVNLIRWKNHPVIHIIRRNVLAAAISEMRAKATGVWHIQEGAERPAAADAKLTVDPADLLRELRARRLEIDLVEAGLRDHKRCLTLYYEELFDGDGQPVPEQLLRVNRLLNLEEPIVPRTSYDRTASGSLRETIENYDAVAAMLAGTGFARYLDAEAPAPRTRPAVGEADR